MRVEKATLGGGCFWCLEAVYELLEGVRWVESGYAGGHVAEPTYETVCSGSTGHAEVVQVEFDPEALTFREVLEVFFVIHDPTTLNRQGNDAGTQYRSVVLYNGDKQKRVTETVIAKLEAESVFADPIVTQVEPLERFWPAEEHHAQYYRRNPVQPYCLMVVGPKVDKFREKYLHRLKDRVAQAPGL
ncbi:MAG: peptide-methionine (S)-S-oxide reductase MsrA [Candidatus Latescibacterota bacterium]|nr:peptide-methionine (S)-S-oxide reductase MsrA [Candidatus Latescibacterota bacterium]